MDRVLKLKHWHLFLIFLLPGYLSRPLGLFSIEVFELILYSLWIYSIAALCYVKSHNHLPVLFFLSSLLLPLLWIVTIFSISVISVITAGLFLLALVFNIFIVTKLFRVYSRISPIWIVLGFLIPIIGVWYIQPVVNQELNDVPG